MKKFHKNLTGEKKYSSVVKGCDNQKYNKWAFQNFQKTFLYKQLYKQASRKKPGG